MKRLLIWICEVFEEEIFRLTQERADRQQAHWDELRRKGEMPPKFEW